MSTPIKILQPCKTCAKVRRMLPYGLRVSLEELERRRIQAKEAKRAHKAAQRAPT